MAILGIRKRIKQVIKDVLGLSAPPSAPSTYTPPTQTNYEAKQEVKQEAKTSEQEATNTPPKQSPFAPQSDSSDEKFLKQRSRQTRTSHKKHPTNRRINHKKQSNPEESNQEYLE